MRRDARRSAGVSLGDLPYATPDASEQVLARYRERRTAALAAIDFPRALTSFGEE